MVSREAKMKYILKATFLISFSIAILCLYSCSSSPFGIEFGNTELQDEFNYENITSIDMDLAHFSVIITGEDSATDVLGQVYAYTTDSFTHQIDEETKTLYIKVVERNLWSIGADDSPRFILTIPHLSSVTAVSSSGHISIENISGAMNIKTQSGHVILDLIEGTLSIETVSGNQNGTDITVAGNSEFSSESGHIILDFTNPLSDFSFDTEARSGLIRIGENVGYRLLLGDGAINITGNTVSGNQEYK